MEHICPFFEIRCENKNTFTFKCSRHSIQSACTDIQKLIKYISDCLLEIPEFPRDMYIDLIGKNIFKNIEEFKYRRPSIFQTREQFRSINRYISTIAYQSLHEVSCDSFDFPCRMQFS